MKDHGIEMCILFAYGSYCESGYNSRLPGGNQNDLPTIPFTLLHWHVQLSISIIIKNFKGHWIERRKQCRLFGSHFRWCNYRFSSAQFPLSSSWFKIQNSSRGHHTRALHLHNRNRVVSSPFWATHIRASTIHWHQSKGFQLYFIQQL